MKIIKGDITVEFDAEEVHAADRILHILAGTNGTTAQVADVQHTVVTKPKAIAPRTIYPSDRKIYEAFAAVSTEPNMFIHRSAVIQALRNSIPEGTIVTGMSRLVKAGYLHRAGEGYYQIAKELK